MAIIGGGIIGSAVAYFLARTHRAGSVAVVEHGKTEFLAPRNQDHANTLRREVKI
jgi:glycine/D-amino acid oxidase-like deaminating enzyme